MTTLNKENKDKNKMNYYDTEVDVLKDLTIGVYAFYDLIHTDAPNFEERKESMSNFLKKNYSNCKIFNNKTKGVTMFYVPVKELK